MPARTPKPRRGRPPTGQRRPHLNATVAPATVEAIEADRRPGESRGQVLDRWAQERASRPQ